MKPEHSKVISEKVKAAIINEARKDRQECQQNCYDFGLYHNIGTDGYFVRYTKSQFRNDYFEQNYRWICFNAQGKRVDCDPIFDVIEDENIFYGNMILIENFTI